MDNTEDEALYAIALSEVKGLSLAAARVLYQAAGSARMVYEERKTLSHLVDNPSPEVCEALSHMDDALSRAEREVTFSREHGIQILTPAHTDYPYRLTFCVDAPLVLYYKGNANLNATHVVSVVGTRHCTDYGRQMCHRIASDLAESFPGVLVVSGLAYGIDINAHRAALNAGLETVGVLAHGLDQIYPALHRNTAIQMISQGGLLTEFMSGVNPVKMNFVRRNRIIAGLCDACIVVESASKGGGLITASIAQSYNKEIFAVPGRVGDVYSEGCNRLIVKNEAIMLQDVAGLIEEMNWTADVAKRKVLKERNLFASFTPEEQRVINALCGSEGKHINLLVAETGLSVQNLSSILFQLEMKGAIRALPGSVYTKA